jgi:hypothetical protein
MSEQERTRFRELRLRHLNRETLTTAEQSELAHYMAIVEQEEAEALRASQERQEARIAALERHAVELRELIARRQALAEYLRRVRDETAREQAEIDAAFERLLTSSDPSLPSVAG